VIPWTAVENAIRSAVVKASGLPDVDGDRRVVWGGRGAARPNVTWISLNVISLRKVGWDWATKENRVFTLSKAISSADTGTGALQVIAHGLASGDGPIHVVKTGSALPAPLAENTDYWAVPVDADHVRLAASFLNARRGIFITLTTTGIGANTLASTSTSARAGAELTRRVRGSREATLSIQCYGSDAQGEASPMAVLEAVVQAIALPSVRYALRQAGVGAAGFSTVRNNGAMVSSTVWEPRAVVEFEFNLASEVEETGTYIERAKIGGTVDQDPERDFTVPGNQ
jgi:hypothetical protein